MRKILNFGIIASILLLGACSNDLNFEDNATTAPGRTLKITASMPDDGPTTRVDLAQDATNGILVTWLATDKIDLAFVQGTTKITVKDVAVTVDPINNKMAYFDIDIPSGINAGAFTLYGVHGGGGLNTNSTFANLPNRVGMATSDGSLGQVQALKDVMLSFEHDMNTTDAGAHVTFAHIGSIFAIHMNNVKTGAITTGGTNPTAMTKIKGFRLRGTALLSNGFPNVGYNTPWAYNAYGSTATQQTYDLATTNYSNTTSGEDFLNFRVNTEFQMNPGDIRVLYAWYPIVPNKTWPMLQVEIQRNAGDSNNGGELHTSWSVLPARQPEVGKTINLYAIITNGKKVNNNTGKWALYSTTPAGVIKDDYTVN